MPKFKISLYVQFQCPYEKLFRSEQYGLMENACREFIFLSEFFMVHGTNAQDLFGQVLGKTLALLTVSTKLGVKVASKQLWWTSSLQRLVH